MLRVLLALLWTESEQELVCAQGNGTLSSRLSKPNSIRVKSAFVTTVERKTRWSVGLSYVLILVQRGNFSKL